MTNRTGLIAILVICLVAGTAAPSSGLLQSLSAEAEAYLTEALDIMQRVSINRYKIDWPAFRARVLEEARGAQVFADTYPAIRFGLQALGDNHSFFIPPQGQSLSPRLPDVGRLIEERFGYVFMRGFAGPNPVGHANVLQGIVREVDAQNPCGWVVDLRRNPGGNMWPMLAGIGPILGEGRLGAFVDPDGNRQEWYYENGVSGIIVAGATRQIVRVTDPVYVVRRSAPPVAVLTGPGTASSGEAVVTAFIGRPLTRSFGRGTRGLSTANASFRLRDGAVIWISVSTFADRTGRVYGGPIDPDEAIDGPEPPDPAIVDPVTRAAIQWLASQQACVTAR